MAKKHKKGNREPRKPKQPKAVPSANSSINDLVKSRAATQGAS